MAFESVFIRVHPWLKPSQKIFQKVVAFILHFDRLPAPRRPKERQDSIIVCRPITDFPDKGQD
jgi:hypothetical protein